MSKKCILCGNTTPTLRFIKNDYRIVRCPECTLTYLDFEPPPREIREFYSEQYFVGLDRSTGYSDYFACEGYLKHNFRRRLAIIEKYRKGGTLLDVGCGPGFFLEILPEHWRASGIDVSQWATRVARERGLDVMNGFFNADIFEPESFDAVTMWNAFEHFEDPTAALASSNRILKPGGILAIYTNNVDSLTARALGKYWHMYILPDHLYFLSRRTLNLMLENAGFTVLKQHYETGFFALDYLIEHFIKIFGIKLNREKLPRFLRALFNRISLPVNFFDTITTYAIKNEARPKPKKD